MKLLLDEMYSRVVAEQLRGRDREVIAVTEHDDRRGQPDADIFAGAQMEERAMVTDNIADYMPLHRDCLAAGQAHHGLVFTSNTRFPRGQPATTGRLVTALDEFLGGAASELEAVPSFVHWL